MTLLAVIVVSVGLLDGLVMLVAACFTFWADQEAQQREAETRQRLERVMQAGTPQKGLRTHV